jgi:nicotinate-nucleotide adenylyltransferase
MRIGLFGGSFNPPHEGHKLVSQQVLKRLNLDAVWWLVSPGNPLKNNKNLPSVEHRVRAARALIERPEIKVTGFEAAHGFRYTYNSLRYLKSRLPARKLVWIMGADNLATFHHWEHWQEIASLMPMAIYMRPGSARGATAARAASVLSKYRLAESDATLLPNCAAPAWVFLHGIMSGLSSSAIRASDENTNLAG